MFEDILDEPMATATVAKPKMFDDILDTSSEATEQPVTTDATWRDEYLRQLQALETPVEPRPTPAPTPKPYLSYEERMNLLPPTTQRRIALAEQMAIGQPSLPVSIARSEEDLKVLRRILWVDMEKVHATQQHKNYMAAGGNRPENTRRKELWAEVAKTPEWKVAEKSMQKFQEREAIANKKFPVAPTEVPIVPTEGEQLAATVRKVYAEEQMPEQQPVEAEPQPTAAPIISPLQTEASTAGDVYRSTGSMALAITGHVIDALWGAVTLPVSVVRTTKNIVFSALWRDYPELMQKFQDSREQSPKELEETSLRRAQVVVPQIRDAMQEIQTELDTEIRKQGGLPAAVAQGLSQEIMKTAITLTGARLVSGGKLPVKPVKEIANESREVAKSAAQFAGYMAATTPGDVKDRLTTATHAAAMVAAPITVAGFNSPWLRGALLTAEYSGLNIGAGAYSAAVDEAKRLATEDGRPDDWNVYLFKTATPMVIQDLVFGIMGAAKAGNKNAKKFVDTMPMDVFDRFAKGYKEPAKEPEKVKPPAEVAPEPAKVEEPAKIAPKVPLKAVEPTVEPVEAVKPAPEVVPPEIAAPRAEPPPIKGAEAPISGAKPVELMTPEEARPVHDALLQETTRLNKKADQAARLFGEQSQEARDARLEADEAQGKSISQFLQYFQRQNIAKALSEKRPVSATSVDAYGIRLPKGYVREGDRYVFKGEVAAQPAEPVAPAKPPMEGPGARAITEPILGETRQLANALKGISTTDTPTSVMSKIKTAVRESLPDKNSLTAILDGMKAAQDWAVKTFKGLPNVTPWRKAVTNRTGQLEWAALDRMTFVKSAKKAVPSKEMQDAIGVYTDAGGDPTVLARGAAAEGPLKKAYQLAQRLPESAKVVSQNLVAYHESQLQKLIDMGMLESGVENYLMRIYDNNVKKVSAAMQTLNVSSLKPNPGFLRKRFYKFDIDAQEAGKHPVPNFIDRVAAYDYAFNKAMADRAFIDWALEHKMTDGRPMLDSYSSAKQLPGDEAPIIVKTQGKKFNEDNPAADRSDYVHLDVPGLRKYKWAGKTEDGKPIFVSGDLLVHPDAIKDVRVLFEPSRLQQVSAIRKALKVSSTIKQTMLSISGFHPVQIAIHGMEHRVNPLNLVQLDRTNRNQDALARAGLMIGGEGRHGMAMEGIVGEALTNKIPGIGKVLRNYNSWTFQEFIPRIKMTMGLEALERNKVRFADQLASGKMSQDQLHALTAEQANAAFGELNWDVLGVSKTSRDVLRFLLLAPDFLIARGRFAGQAFTKYGTEQRVALALGAMTMWTFARIANKLLDDQYHFEPENAFSVVYKGNRYSLRSVQGDLLHLFKEPGRFFYSRLNPVITRTALEAVTGRDYFGRQRDVYDQIKDFATIAVPISFRGLVAGPEQKLWESFLNAFAISNRRWNDMDTAYKMAAKWKESKGIVERGEFIYDAAKDILRPLKVALANGNDADALKALNDLNPDFAARKRMREYFKRYADQPFTGSQKNDREWMATLTEDQKKTVEEAYAHKRLVRQRYLDAIDLWQLQHEESAK